MNFELAPSDKIPGRALLTNLGQAPLTAFVLEIQPESEKYTEPKLEMFDATARTGMLSPIPRGLTLILGVPHILGQPVPSASIAAAVWEDGSTYGPDDILAIVLDNRRATLAAYDLVISTLQAGVEKHWSIAQCVDALEKQKTPMRVLTAPPRLPTLPQPNVTISLAETALGGAHSGLPDSSIKYVVNVLTQTRDQLAASLPPDTEHAQTLH